jgi:hypothetical protein
LKSARFAVSSKQQFADFVKVERTPGRIVVAFKDGSKRNIPGIVGNLDDLLDAIALRRGHDAR